MKDKTTERESSGRYVNQYLGRLHEESKEIIKIRSEMPPTSPQAFMEQVARLRNRSKAASSAFSFQRDDLRAESGPDTANRARAKDEGDGETSTREPKKSEYALYQRIPPEAARGVEENNQRALRDTANVASIVHRPGESPSESLPGREKQRLEAFALRKWARVKGLMFPAEEFNKNWREQGKAQGAENQVYLSLDCRTVLKRNNLGFHASYIEYFERIALHNYLFPDAKLTFVGFTESEGILKPVTSQDFITAKVGKSPDEERTLRDEAMAKAKERMEGLGFKSYDKDEWNWYNPTTGVVVEDLHDQNSVIDHTGRVRIFDPIVYPEPTKQLMHLTLIPKGMMEGRIEL